MIFDPKCEREYERRAVVVTTPVELVAAAQAMGEGWRVLWRGLASMERGEAFELFNRVAWAVENCMIVWEEVDNFIGPGKLPPWAFRLVNEGRHRGVRIIATARRPARVSRDLTANASRLIVFRTTEPVDLKYLREYVGAEAEVLPGLPDHHALDWAEAGGVAVKKSPFV